MKRFFSLVLLAALVGVLGLLHQQVRNESYGDFPEPVFVDIPRGTSSWVIGEELTKAGVLRNPLLYQLARLTRPGKGAKAGEYQFTHAATPAQVFARLAAGDVFHIDVVVPEGSTMFDIANLVEHAGIGKADEFLRAARSPKLIHDLAPSALSLEGYLFPATYRFGRKSTVNDVCQAMTAQFRKVHTELAMRGDPSPTVTLASMVEKEAKIPEERPRIAGVYAARLRIGMKLDCDPTVMYAAQLDGTWDGVIRRSETEEHEPVQHVCKSGPAAGADRQPWTRLATRGNASPGHGRSLLRCRAWRHRSTCFFKRPRRSRQGRVKLSS